MEEDQEEKDSSSDEAAHIIEDEDMEDSPPDTPEFWIPDRNDDDANFVRGKRDSIPTKKYPEVVSEVTIDCSREEKVFQRYGQGWYGDTDFVSRRQVLVRLWCVYVHTYIHMLYVCVYVM